MVAKTLRHIDLQPSHPGELLREIVIPATGKSKVEIAQLLGISRQSLYDILAERQSITPAMAVRVGKMFGDGPEVWLKMQAAHDLWQAARDLKDEVADIPTLHAA
ncbi:MAG TPA: HigA family addiction module antitoxin [Methylovirgula sp.]